MSRRLGQKPVKPDKVDGQRAIITQFYKDLLRKKVKGIFEIECPDDWDKDYLLNTMLSMGYIVVTDSECGVLPLRGALAGQNYFRMPTQAIITVPMLRQMHRTIGVDCELVYLERTPMNAFWTFSKLIETYAEKLASCDAGIDVNIMNSKMAYMIDAETRAQAETIKELYDKVSEGEPLVVYRKDMISQGGGLEVFFGNVKQNFIVGDLQDAKRTIINEFLTEIGINNANTDKKERLNADEVNANNEEIQDNISVWKDNLEKCCEKIKKMFPEVNFSMKLKFDVSNVEGGTDDTTRVDRSMGNKEDDSKS